MDDGRCEAWKDEVDNLLIFVSIEQYYYHMSS